MSPLRLLLVALLLAGCNDFSRALDLCRAAGGCGADAGAVDAGATDAGELDAGSDAGTLRLFPQTPRLVVDDGLQFGADGGVPPYLFSVEGGGTIDELSGAYRAPLAPASVTVTVTDSASERAQVGFEVRAAVAVTDPGAVGNLPVQLAATGGFPPYTWSLRADCGATLTDGGLFTGPADGGRCAVRATDTEQKTGDLLLPVAPELNLSPRVTELAVGNSEVFEARGGRPPYVFSIDPADAGTLTTTATSATFTATAPGLVAVHLADQTGTDLKTQVTVFPALSIAPVTRRVAVGETFTFTASGGVPPLSWQLTSAVGRMDAGVFVGETVGAGGIFCTDARSNSATASVSVIPPLSLSPSTLTLAPGNTFEFSVTGGAPPYLFSVDAGLGSITDAGVFTAASGNASAFVTVTDDDNRSAKAQVTVRRLLQASASYDAGTDAEWCVAADWNNDGRVDLAATSPADRVITVFMSNVAGMTASPALSFSGAPARPLAVNLTSDALPDLVVPLPTDVLSYRGNGNGTFSAGPLNVSLPGSGLTAVAEDWNNDGQPDVATSYKNVSSGVVFSLSSSATGNYPTSTPVTLAAETLRFGLGQLNGGGANDLLLLQSDNAVRSLFSNGGTSFTPGPPVTLGEPASSMAVGNFDGAGGADFALGMTSDTSSTNVWVYLNASSTADFAPPLKYPVPAKVVDLVTVDLDRDGVLDLLALTVTNDLAVLLGNPNGTFRTGGTYATGATSDVSSLAVGDFSGDGKPDVAVCARKGAPNVFVLMNVAP